MDGLVAKPPLAFLSTLPARGATEVIPCDLPKFPISIHAPREGIDPPSARRPLPRTTFLSTLPARGATTVVSTAEDVAGLISIHAPREGSDGRG